MSLRRGEPGAAAGGDSGDFETRRRKRCRRALFYWHWPKLRL